MNQSTTENIIKNHKTKSRQVRRLKKKLKNIKKKQRTQITHAELTQIYLKLKQTHANPLDFEGLGSFEFDNEGFDREEAKIEAKRELIQQLLNLKN